MIRRTNGGAKAGRIWRAFALLPALGLAGCIPQAELAGTAGAPAQAFAASPQLRTAQFVPLPEARPEPAPTPATAAQRILETRIASIARRFDGEVGIAMKDVQTGWSTSWNGQRLFPQQSVSKFWVALTALDRVDQGALDLSRDVTIRREDLTLFHQPIANQVGANGYTTSLENLLFRAITHSDNTANDTVLRNAGGPNAVREMLSRKGISNVRFGPGERLMQSHIAGLEWDQSLSAGRAFYRARSAVPASVRSSRFNDYVADPVDGASPLAIVEALARLQQGDLLSPASTRHLLSTMAQTRTGRQRLTGGLAEGWRIAHKTGTGQVWGGEQAGYNDIGILTSPDGRHYAVAVMIGRTGAPVPVRMEMMQDVTRAVIAYHDNQAQGGERWTR